MFFYTNECIFSTTWIKYWKNTIKVQSLYLSLFEDDNKATKFLDCVRSFVLL